MFSLNGPAVGTAKRKSPHKAGFSDFICPRGELSPTCPKASAAILSCMRSLRPAQGQQN